MNHTRRMVFTALFCAMAIACSNFLYIPLGIVRAYPIQHFMNIMLAIIVGTRYAISGAFIVSFIRNLLGVGSIFAFPGSMIGAFLAGIIYKKTNHLLLTALGEVFGTGIIGSLLCYPIASLILGEKTTLFAFLPSFLFSSLIGATLSFVLLKFLLPYWQLRKEYEV